MGFFSSAKQHSPFPGATKQPLVRPRGHSWEGGNVGKRLANRRTMIMTNALALPSRPPIECPHVSAGSTQPSLQNNNAHVYALRGWRATSPFSFGSYERWTISTSAIWDRRTAERRRLGPRRLIYTFQGQSKRAPKSSTSRDESAFFGRQRFTQQQRWQVGQLACSGIRCFVCMTLKLDFRLLGFSSWALAPLIPLPLTPQSSLKKTAQWPQSR
jgi:hypothetical protein